ncbi:MAG: DUF3285 domain-containing protein [Thermosynechococcaceae cyanobacterium MS004]|nr:DUF3285 domain-containing protein [Thermosynechococcaceae cyanobacterium MS004]
MESKPTDASSPEAVAKQTESDAPTLAASEATEPKDSYVKLAMRNMVRKSRQSLTHFALTTFALLGVLVGLAYLTR